MLLTKLNSWIMKQVSSQLRGYFVRNKAFELLEGSSTIKGCPESMRELQSQIESLQVTNIEEASDIIKKYPGIMSLLIDHKLMTAKSEFLLKESRREARRV